MAERFTAKQGQYLAFIHNYIVMFGQPPAEAELQRFFGTTPPTVHQMLRKLADRGLISRIPGQARSIEVLIDPEEIPRLLRPQAPDI
jgi:repressor LexA